MQQKNAGFVALLSALLAVAIMLLLFAKFYFAPREQVGGVEDVQPVTVSETPPTTEMWRMRADVDAAEKTRQLLNEQNKAINAVLVE